MSAIDLLIVGAGPTGCVIADRAARSLGWRCLVVDKRPHVAGNCYDRYHESGLLMHEYGPHYFRTNSAALVHYLSQFTAFHRADYVARASHGGRLFPFPINLTTLELFFGTGPLTPESGERLFQSKRHLFEVPANSEELVLSRVGSELYKAFYESYTLKQWGRHPRELEASVCGRIPVRLSRDDRYVDHRFQIMPTAGFTKMFAAMLDHPEIEVRLGTDFAALRDVVRPRRATVYCGPLDEYFDHRLGRLPWRSLSFDVRLLNQRFAQPCVQINYPNDHGYTRSVEIKHVTRQNHSQTLVVDEYPRAEGEPYYPVPSAEARCLCEGYRELAREETRRERVYFCGRLAEYRYINIDEAIERALDLVHVLSTDCNTPAPDR